MDELDHLTLQQERLEQNHMRLRAQANKLVSQSASHCHECDEAIPRARRMAIVGVRLCVSCQDLQDKRARRW